MLRGLLLEELKTVPVDRVEKLRWLKELTSLFHQFLYDELTDSTGDIKAERCAQPELADIGFFLREMEVLFDECRKEVKARKELSAKVMANRLAKDSLTNAETDSVVRGQYARASVDIKMRVKLPARGTPEYFKVMEFCGVPQEAIENGVVKIDWNGASNLVTKRMEDGVKIPAGLTETYPEFVCVYTKLKDRKDK